MGKLDGKIALVTGGSDGIGLATAKKFICEGAEHVFITGRRQQMLDEAVQSINSEKVTAVRADVSKMDDLDNLYNFIKKEKGRLDILFANAGVCELLPLHLVTEKHFDDTFNVNVKGVLFTVQKALPIFSDSGSIILNGSICAIKGPTAQSVYSASKAAVRSFARCWIIDLKERHIRINVLSPGPVHSAMIRSFGKNQEENKAFLDYVTAISPMARLGTPDEIAQVAVFLASDDSSYITGIELFADGGIAQI